MTTLRVEHLCKAFGGVRALNDISFSVASGEMVALLGPNGAGKSTCFNILAGNLSADSGSVVLDGRELSGLGSRQIGELGMGRTFQVAQIFSSLSVLGNIQMALLASEGRAFDCLSVAHEQYREPAHALLEQTGLSDHAARLASVLAYGDVKRLELAMTLAQRPRVLLMDEPTAGMGPTERHDLMALVHGLVEKGGLAVLFTEHSLDVVFGFAQRMIVLARGEVIAEGEGPAIRDDPKVREVYLGSRPNFSRVSSLKESPR
jgi:branched-chain amino acid transport system ATP-binding protein